MPAADTPYIIGVIREKEKRLLQADEYTRLIDAPTAATGLEALIDTPYGMWLTAKRAADQPIVDAATAHLAEEQRWLADLMERREIMLFIAARFDALNIASALFDRHDTKSEVQAVSPLGTIRQEVLNSVIWHDQDIDQVDAIWQPVIQREVAALTDPSWRKQAVLERLQQDVGAVMRANAISPLMKRIAAWYDDRLAADQLIRTRTANESTPPEQVLAILTGQGYTRFTAPVLHEAQQNHSAAAYERLWDESLLDIIREFRHEPTGYNSIVAYWYAKEIEARTVRLLTLGKLSNLAPNVLREVQRSLYQSWL